MDASDFDNHSKSSAFEELIDLLFENCTKFIEITKNKTDSASNSGCLSQLVELSYNFIPSIEDFYESNFSSIYTLLEKLNTFR